MLMLLSTKEPLQNILKTTGRAGPSDLIKTVLFYLSYSKEYGMFSWFGVHVVVCSSVAALTPLWQWKVSSAVFHISKQLDHRHLNAGWCDTKSTGAERRKSVEPVLFPRESIPPGWWGFQELTEHFRSWISGVSIRLWDQSTQSVSEWKFLWNSYWRTNQRDVLNRMDCDCSLDKRH